ncbi:Armadillo-like helical [Penicillium malachiteum]|uniref:Armadillo-like helical n=1 Tax=Penicillium malachiteum TaxID=1324776 RepID=UPI0025467DE9|nr:Armadillo-like helical [Penicillium malachiteum]KAJ5714515.1 Armadillo-like helical [Penicillium malachiteum]
MSSIMSQPKLPVPFINNSGGVRKDPMDSRNLTFGREPSSHFPSSSHHSSSDILDPPRNSTHTSSSEDSERPSSKKQKFDHTNAESLVARSSELETILAKLSPGIVSAIDSESMDPCSGDEMELARLRQQLVAANSRIAFQEQELAQSRVIKHTMDQALGPPSEADFGGREITEQTISHLQSAFNASNTGFSQFQDAWNSQEDSQSDVSDALSAGAYNRARGLWNQQGPLPFGMGPSAPFEKSYTEAFQGVNNTSQDSNRFWSGPPAYSSFASQGALQSQRILSGPSATTYGFYSRPPVEQARFAQAPNMGPRRSTTQGNRTGNLISAQSNSWGGIVPGSPAEAAPKSPSLPPVRPSGTFSPIGIYQMPPFPPRPMSTTLSPTATEFTAGNTNSPPWANSSPGASSIQTYVSPLEPLNYRRLLDKNVSCDWKYIVDKIICNNDQQASIFLQQKLKVGTTEQKYEIIEAIVSQAYPLMINRFGNFLVQRCFEHGTPEQIISIANAIRGNTLTLSMDPFGCHVIQKAFDCVPEEHKAVMVHELLRRIPETVIHRYACHVWQKLFELRWTSDPPQIMTKVNDSLRGIWHEVALGETGSLVVQNIFENCVEEEKRPAIEEVLAKVDVLAHGQFGNWCIQHICEHGAPHDKSRATEHVLHYAVDYSMDQFASKIVEKCLKIGGSEFLDRYLARVCTGRTDRPRMPLIDIAGDQYGNYLIQWILMNAAPHQRELVASHIRKHMVSLRGSKFGSRVAMLCCNPSHATRPGPGTGIQMGRLNHFNEERFASASQNNNRFSRGGQWNPNYAPFR